METSTVLVVAAGLQSATVVALLLAWRRHALRREGELLRIGEEASRREASLGAALEESEERFRQSQKVEEIGRLAGSVAHDFNNMLTAITGYSALLLKKLPAGDPMRKELEQIQKAGDRSAALTRQILAFSRRSALEPRLLDINAIVADMEPMLRRLIGEDVQLASTLGGAPGHVMGDPGQIEQVLLNLCVNARDAMPHGGRLVIETRLAEVDEEFVSRHVGAKPGHCLLLTVSDTGVGMDGATVSRIFEPFFTTKGPGKGTGLGLATVFGIVKQAGGYIWVESEPGRGTTFKIFLPLAGAPGALEPVDTASAPVLEGKETILVLEDEEIVRSLVRRVLGMRGYAVLEARSATEAAAIARRHAGRIHLLLTDVVMPEIDGPEAARMITLQRPDVRVLFMSGYSDGVIRLRGLPSADAAFIEKPFTPDGLAGKVRDVLDGRDPGFQ